MAKRRRKQFKYAGNYTKLVLLVVAAVTLSVWVLAVLTQSNRQIDPADRERAQRIAFINEVHPYAQQLQRQYKVLASINIAQAILESNWGSSDLSRRYNNFYGVKSEDPDNSVVLKTQEYENGEWVTINGRFQVYKSWQDSMLKHTLLLVNGTSYNTSQYQKVLEADDYKAAAQALYDGGYATDPTYSDKIIQIIETWHLNQYDK